MSITLYQIADDYRDILSLMNLIMMTSNASPIGGKNTGSIATG
ncbi:hypothetical protein [Chromatium okenii]|nr:hypothetical protein [Chromatium okenii]